jgi:glycosyltransferase involved in cell wall biosynthesis
MGLRVIVIRHVIMGLQKYVDSNLRPLLALARRGHNVVYVAATGPGFRRSDVETQHFKTDFILLRKVVPIVWWISFDLVVFFRMVKSIGRWDAIVLDPMSIPALFPVLALLRLRSHPPALILRTHTNPTQTGGALRTLVLSFLDVLSMKLAALVCDRMLFISPMMGQMYSDQLGIPKSKVGVLPSSVDTTVFHQFSAVGAVRLREELRVGNRLVVLYHGELSAGRGIMELVEAFRILKGKSARVVLLMLGYGPSRMEVESYVQANQLDDVVVVRGPVDYAEVPRYVAACDAGIVALPDHIWWRYQCPIKLLECLAMNKPVIISDIPANRWVVGNAPVALYLKGTSAQEIADGICEFIDTRNHLNPTLGAQLASGFSVEKVAETLEYEILATLESNSKSTLDSRIQ